MVMVPCARATRWVIKKTYLHHSAYVGFYFSGSNHYTSAFTDDPALMATSDPALGALGLETGVKEVALASNTIFPG